MSASISTLPVWKKDSTAAEWLEELAAMAREHPERWQRVVVIFEECNAGNQPTKSRMYSRNHDHNTGILGALEGAKLDLWEYMKGRA